MSAVVDKNVQISADRARRLSQLAAERATTENALVEESLDLLFREQARQAALEALLEEDREELRRLEVELGPLPLSERRPHRIDRTKIVSIVGTPIDPRHLRRPGDDY